MTRIERAKIEGFKGIRSLEFEPSGLNLITGRNNTGKTSVLEAISISIDPKRLNEYEGKIDKVISVERDTAKICLDFKKGGKNNLETREVTLSQLPKERLFEVISKKIYNSFDSGLKNNISIGKDSHISHNRIAEEVSERVLHRVSQDAESFRRDFLKVTINNSEYVFLDVENRLNPTLYDVMREVVSDIANNPEKIGVVSQQTLDAFSDEQTNPRDVEADEIREDQLYRRLRIHLRGSVTGGFIFDKPNKIVSPNFISSQDANLFSEPPETDNEAIVLDDIEDFVKEREILPNMKSLGMEHVVFQSKNGEKNIVPYEFMGDGFKTIVGILWKLFDKNHNDIVLIEEPENHLHPGYVQELIYFLIQIARDDNAQLFITTHDADFIGDFFTDAICLEDREFLEDKFSVLRLEENVAQQLDYEEAEHELKDLHLDLRGI
mgnify:CR=1 FL=1